MTNAMSQMKKRKRQISGSLRDAGFQKVLGCADCETQAIRNVFPFLVEDRLNLTTNSQDHT